MKILIKIGIGVSLGVNLFIKDTIIEEVYKQIKFVMPKQSGGVIK